jgi:aspartyl-tRNA(Asn)/glutamyl-tRNA(Gln) amidotransferase subunit C
MKINKELITKLADLANLELKEGEINKFSQQLSEIVAFVEKLNSVKEEFKLKRSYSRLKEISRDDNASLWDKDEREIALSQSRRQSGLIKAPKIR